MHKSNDQKQAVELAYIHTSNDNTNPPVPTPSIPTKDGYRLNPEHYQEWLSSCVDGELIQANNIRSVEGDGVYDYLLGCTEADRRNDGRLTNQELKRYDHCRDGGWWFYSVSVRDGSTTEYGCFKPDHPRENSENGQLIKYEAPKGSKPEILAFEITPKIWKKISDRYGVPIGVYVNFYLWLKDHPEIPLLITEGAKKVGCLLSMEYAAIGVSGVTHCYRTEDGVRKLHPDIEYLCNGNRVIYFAFDVDPNNKTRKIVHSIIRKTAGLIKDYNANCKVFKISWNGAKGVDDFVNLNEKKAFETQVKKAKFVTPIAPNYEDENPKQERFNPTSYNLPAWEHSEVGRWIAAKYKNSIAWNLGAREFYLYGSQFDGVWSIVPEEKIRLSLHRELDQLLSMYRAIMNEKGENSRHFAGFSVNFLEGVFKCLKVELARDDWESPEHLMPFTNGVLDRRSMKLMPHSPDHRMTWCLPYGYDPLASCQPLQEWLLETVNNDESTYHLILGYLHGIVTGRTDWQKYLELIGPGGTGKSTLIRLATALVGKDNCHSTTLSKLETSRFETASLKDKKLVMITDAERFGGGASVLKAVTGQDMLPYERKLKQSGQGFIPQCLVVLAANEPISLSDYTSGLERRRLVVNFNNRIPSHKQRDLISISHKGISGEFADYLPGLMNLVLSIVPETATSIILNYGKDSPEIEQMRLNSLIENNPIAAWADQCLVLRSNYQSKIGVATRSKDHEELFVGEKEMLYPSYARYCETNGVKMVHTNRFSRLLHDLLVNQLNFTGISKGRDRNGSYFLGVKVRGKYDDEQLLITEKVQSSPITSDSSISVDDVDGVTIGVTMKTRISDDCDDNVAQNEFKSKDNKIDYHQNNINHHSSDNGASPPSQEKVDGSDQNSSINKNCSNSSTPSSQSSSMRVSTVTPIYTPSSHDTDSELSELIRPGDLVIYTHTGKTYEVKYIASNGHVDLWNLETGKTVGGSINQLRKI